jgi:hypothetical protein
LNGRARNRAVRTKHAAVAIFGLEPLPASLSVIEELTGIRLHQLNRAVTAMGAGDSRLLDHGGKYSPAVEIPTFTKPATIRSKTSH